ncbi:MAG: excinuclease ABC subunit UvrC [Chlamydiae bacterium]|nr:excinuclease ABC subunit UvrC [Chlamydiota bacterium]MBI3265871.1 excinuclease ABC subunit UvrC [Chlamydiota bacterium]
MNLSKFIQKKVRETPQKPGIYLMRDEMGQIIYVGKAKRLRARLLSHFQGRDLSPKAKAMLGAVRDIDFILLKSEEEALILECQYIKEFKPKYNVSYRDDKTYPFLKVTLNEDFPRFLITRLKKEDGALYLGPYTDAAALKKTVEALQKIFRIRTCTPRHPTERDYKHCLYQMMHWCSAPCVEKISAQDYRASVESACQVLMGHSNETYNRISAEMKEASGNLDFEKAALLRDRLRALENIVSSRHRSVRNFKRLSSHAQAEALELGQVLGLEKPPQRIEAFDISCLSGSEAVGSMVHFFEGHPDKRFYRRFKIKTVEGINDFAMMHEVVTRRYKRLKEEGGVFPDLILIDGGKGQLSYALSALEALGLDSLAVIGLAKRYEEIVTPHGKDSIRLGSDSGALHLIQRVRDEAHRFAVTYHKKLRAAKLKESLLDDVPGLGDAKKKLLMEHFGSVEKIKKATLEELRQVKGISEKLAHQVDTFLKSKI